MTVDAQTVLDAAKAFLKECKRLESLLLAFGTAALFALDAYWSRYGAIWSYEAIALLVVGLLTVTASVYLAVKRAEITMWKVFVVTAAITFGFALLYSGSLLLYGLTLP